MMKSLPGQNITYSLFHQIIKQTEASYRILKGSRGTGDKQEKKVLIFMKNNKSALSSLWLLMWEPPAVTLAASQKREDYTEPENQEKNVMYYRHEGISLLPQNRVLLHSTGCLGSKRLTQKAVVNSLKRIVGFTALNEYMEFTTRLWNPPL